jgi:hypothetical protein
VPVVITLNLPCLTYGVGTGCLHTRDEAKFNDIEFPPLLDLVSSLDTGSRSPILPSTTLCLAPSSIENDEHICLRFQAVRARDRSTAQ